MFVLVESSDPVPLTLEERAALGIDLRAVESARGNEIWIQYPAEIDEGNFAAAYVAIFSASGFIADITMMDFTDQHGKPKESVAYVGLDQVERLEFRLFYSGGGTYSFEVAASDM